MSTPKIGPLPFSDIGPEFVLAPTQTSADLPFRSFAKWPKGTVTNGHPSYEDDTTYDDHGTREQAQAVCDRLKREGFGGQGKVFPVRAYVLEVKTAPWPMTQGECQAACIALDPDRGWISDFGMQYLKHSSGQISNLTYCSMAVQPGLDGNEAQLFRGYTWESCLEQAKAARLHQEQDIVRGEPSPQVTPLKEEEWQ